MERTFTMIEKGQEYMTEGYTIRKVYERVNKTNCGHSVLDRYGYQARWVVYQDGEPRCNSFAHLKDAKQFILKRDLEFSTRPAAAENMTTRQLNYLFNLAETTVQMRKEGHTTAVSQNLSTARGYIRCLIDCQVLGENTFRLVWEWWKKIVGEEV